MENQYKKWVTFSYLALAALVAFVLFTVGLKVSGSFDLEARVRNIDLYIRLGSLLVGAIVFLGFSRNDQSNQFMHEVVAELSRVTWPTSKETSSATFIVIIMVLISALVLGFLDYVWTKVLQMVL